MTKVKEKLKVIEENASLFFLKIDDWFFDFFHKKGWLIIMILALILSTVSKLYLFDYRSGDYNSFLQHWIKFYQDNGGFSALGQTVGDYTPFYNYILCLIATFKKANDLYLIKIVSLIFDFVLALGFFFIIDYLFKNKNYASITFSIALILPSVIINGALWGQCDAIFTSFVVWSFYFILKEKYNTSMLLFSLALSIKLQAIFFLPFLFLLFLKRKIKLYQFLYIPIIYIIVAIPSIIAGRDFIEVMTIYFRQADQYKNLSLSAPSLYSFIDNTKTELFANTTLFVFLVVTMSYIFYFYQKDFEFNKENLVTIALISCLFSPFFLPYMHERYFFIADIFSLLYLFIKKKGFGIALCINIASVICCYYWITGGLNPFWGNINLVRVASSFNLVAIILIMKDVKINFKPKPIETN